MLLSIVNNYYYYFINTLTTPNIDMIFAIGQQIIEVNQSEITYVSAKSAARSRQLIFCK
jgi:hypothetical protein